MLAPKSVVVVLLVATQLQPIKALDLLEIPQTIINPFPAPLQEAIRNMWNPSDTEMVNQAIGSYPLLTEPTVQFSLYCNKSNHKEFFELHTGDMEELEKTCFVKNACVKILIHGWGHTRDTPCIFPQNTKDVYLEFGNCPNIIIMDYSRMFGYWTFVLFIAKGHIETRDQGAAFIKWLDASNAANMSQIHVLGFSLGALVAAETCAKVYEDTGHKVGRLTILDVGNVCSEPTLCSGIHQIDPNNAAFVDAYHTARSLLSTRPVGHVDLEINGGIQQPFLPDPATSHAAATYIFEGTIRDGPNAALECASDGTPVSWYSSGRRCDRYVSFGEYISYTTRGQYYMLIPFSKFIVPVTQAIQTCAPRL